MGIEIGDKNKIKNSIIVDGAEVTNNPDPEKHIVVDTSKKRFSERHPVLVSVLISVIASLVVGVILLFPFWKDIINWIVGLFRGV